MQRAELLNIDLLHNLLDFIKIFLLKLKAIRGSRRVLLKPTKTSPFPD